MCAGAVDQKRKEGYRLRAGGFLSLPMLVVKLIPGLKNDGCLNFVDENDEVLISGFGRRGKAKGDIPGVRFKVVKVSGVGLLALWKEKKVRRIPSPSRPNHISFRRRSLGHKCSHMFMHCTPQPLMHTSYWPMYYLRYEKGWCMDRRALKKHGCPSPT